MKLVLEKNKGTMAEQLASIDKGELSELEAFDIIDTYSVSEGDEILKGWVSKLAHKGIITLSCTDMIAIAKLVGLRILSIEEANIALFGLDGSRKAAYSNQVLGDTLKQLGLKILKNRTVDCRVCVVAQRP